MNGILPKVKNNKLIVLGIMSGTSLDGLDLALCEFETEKGKTVFKILKAKTYSYNSEWTLKLQQVPDLSAYEYARQHSAYGRLIAGFVKRFLKNTNYRPQAIASHGHTVFHQPQLGFTTQMGCGATIAALTGITTVCDFRSLDVALNGQGAPLVPVGDKLLFGNYKACLNIGGIANVSFNAGAKRVAYDICEANMLLNFLAGKAGCKYDDGGKMAAAGKVDTKLLKALNAHSYYKKNWPKSLGREWFESEIVPLLNLNNTSVNDLLSTATEHVAHIIAGDLNKYQLTQVLITGGGALNTYLIKLIADKTKCKLIVPDRAVINFKEALIFAFLGYLRLRERTNTLATVTGARANSIGGAVYIGKL